MELSRQLDKMNAEELRSLTATLIAQLAERDAERSAHAALIATRDAELKAKQLKIDQLMHEMATLKRWRYGRHSEQLDVVQRWLLDESIDEDIEAIGLEIEALKEKPATLPKEKPQRVALPASFPRREVRHEPEETPLWLRLHPGAHRRGCEREARLYPRRARARATHPR
jgi:transposase